MVPGAPVLMSHQSHYGQLPKHFQAHLAFFLAHHVGWTGDAL